MRTALAAILVLVVLIAAAALTAAPASAQTSLSQEIGETGLAATEARLAAVPDPGADDRFALGGVRFLRAVERALQTRWRTGIVADGSTQLPVLRIPLPANPSPEPFEAATIPALFRAMSTDLDGARQALEGIDGDVAVELRLGDLWFDIDADGRRGPEEGVIAIAGATLFGGQANRQTGKPLAGAAIRFDTADTAWLLAYTHLLSGLCDVVAAFDPEDATARILEARQAFTELQGDVPPVNSFDYFFGPDADRLAIIVLALRQQPDAARIRSARDHLLSVIAENRRFWTLVAEETDDVREWIPNDRQHSALGLALPPGIGARWLAVLDEAEAALTGARLIPHWRLGGGAGIDLSLWLEAPTPIDVGEWAHGIGVLPFARQGERLSPASWFDFRRLVQGDAGLYAVFLN